MRLPGWYFPCSSASIGSSARDASHSTPNLTYGELRRALRRLGIEEIRRGTRHDWYGRPEGNQRTLIPRHRGEIPTGTLHGILDDLGLTLADLRRAGR